LDSVRMSGHTVAVHTGSVKGVHSNRSETLVPVFIGVVVDQAVSSGESRRLLLWPAVLTVLHICLSRSLRLGARAGERGAPHGAHRADRPRLRLGRRPGTRFSGRSGAGTALRRARVRPPPPARQGADRAGPGPPEHPRLPRDTRADQRARMADGVAAARLLARSQPRRVGRARDRCSCRSPGETTDSR
jgi:hypothetical protein